MEAKKYTGKNVNDALTNATVDLGVTSDQINYEVVDEGSNGFLGLGSREAVILVTLKSDEKEEVKEVIKEEPVKEVKADKAPEVQKSEPKAPVQKITKEEAITSANEFLSKVFEAMKLEVSIDVKYDESTRNMDIDLSGPEMGVLIGKRGMTLDSLQYLTNLAVNHGADGYVRVKIDTENYRERRKETLENLARNVASKVKKTHKTVSLEAMNPYERRVIHTALQNDKYVTTHSEGEEPYRHVVVTLKK